MRRFIMTSCAAAALALVSGTPGEAAAHGPVTAPADAPTLASLPKEESAVFAGGCFWGVEGVFEHIKGVRMAESGYAGGTGESASYDKVSGGRTGHAEAVRVFYDPSQVTYEQLLHVFFAVAHDPTQLNRQGPDTGPQYRSAVFYSSDTQRVAVTQYVAKLTDAKAFKNPIVTQVAPLAQFFVAEDYHQDYMKHHPDQPYIVYNDAPKVEALKKQFPALYR